MLPREHHAEQSRFASVDRDRLIRSNFAFQNQSRRGDAVIENYVAQPSPSNTVDSEVIIIDEIIVQQTHVVSLLPYS